MTSRRADLILILANLVWGVSFVVVKGALAASTPLAFTALRFTIAAVVLLPFIPLRARWSRSELVAGGLLGTLLAIGFAMQAVGLVSTTPSRSAFIVATSSVIAAALAFVVIRERPRPTVIVALGLAAIGMYLLTAPGPGGVNRGDLLTCVTAVCFGGQIVAVSYASRHYHAVRLVWMQTVVTAIGAALAAAAWEDSAMHWNVSYAAALIYAAVFATALALLWQMQSQQFMSSARAALIFCLEPVFAAITSWLWLGEHLSVPQWAGGILILGGMLLPDLPVFRRSATPAI